MLCIHGPSQGHPVEELNLIAADLFGLRRSESRPTSIDSKTGRPAEGESETTQAVPGKFCGSMRGRIGENEWCREPYVCLGCGQLRTPRPVKATTVVIRSACV